METFMIRNGESMRKVIYSNESPGIWSIPLSYFNYSSSANDIKMKAARGRSDGQVLGLRPFVRCFNLNAVLKEPGYFYYSEVENKIYFHFFGNDNPTIFDIVFDIE